MNIPKRTIAVLLLAFLLASPAFAGSATWKASPPTNNWSKAGSWAPATIPNGPSDIATFATSSKTSVSISANTEVDSIVFNAGASPFTITAPSSTLGGGGPIGLGFSGSGITNNSATAQDFIVSGATVDRNAGGYGGNIGFANSATAGNARFTVEGGTVADSKAGTIFFDDTSTAGTGTFITNPGNASNARPANILFENSSTAANGTFTNNGSAVSDASGGGEGFFDTSNASNATFANNGGTAGDAPGGFVLFGSTSSAGNGTFINKGGVNGGLGGITDFVDDSTGGTSRIELFANGNLDISGHNAPGVAIGSIEGDGIVFLGANNLTVGSNNLLTVFSGAIQDGGLNGGAGGSLTKIGGSKLILSNPNGNSYSGGTTVSAGTLILKNTAGSATGTGAVKVDKGILGGTGRIAGAVTVGNGISAGAIILGGNSATLPGTLTINKKLTLKSLSTYKCVLKRGATTRSSQITVNGMAINSTATFTFLDSTTGTLTPGTVFTVINNISTNPISGRFSNLSDGLIFTSNGTDFKVSYTGGTGNDLTLTVQ